MKTENSNSPSVYNWIAGSVVLEVLTGKFYEKISADGLLRPLLSAMGVEQPVKDISEDLKRRWINLLFATADEVGLPADPSFRSKLAAYFEWKNGWALSAG